MTTTEPAVRGTGEPGRPGSGAPTLDDRLAGRDAPTGPRPPSPRPLPAGRRRLTGPLVGQLVAVEVVVFAVAAAFGRAGWLLAVAVAVAVVTVALLLGRWRGRWWYQQVSLWWRHRRRTGQYPPEPRVMDVTGHGDTFALAYDGTGWFAVVAVDAAEAGLPLRQLAELVAGGGQLSRLQIVTHTSPAPVARLQAWAPAAASYQDVAAKLTGPVPPGQRRTYLAVRLDAADAVAVAGSRGGGTAGVARALAAAVQRVDRTLSTVDAQYRLLTADELRPVLSGSLGFGPATPDRHRAGAQWESFVADGYAQVSFQVTGWPPAGERLAAALDPVPAAWTTLNLLLGPDSDRVEPGETALRGYLRVAAAPDAIAPACDALVKAAALQGLVLRRLDGEQGPAAYATAPTGGADTLGAAGHACPTAALDQLAPPVRRGGVLLGRDPQQHPVLVSLFTHRPLRVVLVGGVWPARVVLLRCLAVGARVVAAAGQPDWVSLGRWATGADHWVLPAGAGVPPAHPAAPVLVSVDPVGGNAPPPAAWQTVATTCPRPSVTLLAGADLLVTGRLLPADADLVARRFGLAHEATRLLSQLYDDMVAVVEPGTVRYAWPTPSSVEREILTPPRQTRPALGTPPR